MTKTHDNIHALFEEVKNAVKKPNSNELKDLKTILKENRIKLRLILGRDMKNALQKVSEDRVYILR